MHAPADALWVDVEAFESAAAQARRTADPGTYRAALSRDAACAFLAQEAGRTLDETIVAALLGVLERQER